VNKKSLSESDICDRFITPALTKSGWESHQWRREFAFTDGRIIVRGKMVARGKQKRADYLLFYKPNLPIAVIEAKDNNHSLGAGILRLLVASNQSVPLSIKSSFSVHSSFAPIDHPKRRCINYRSDTRERGGVAQPFCVSNLSESCPVFEIRLEAL